MGVCKEDWGKKTGKVKTGTKDQYGKIMRAVSKNELEMLCTATYNNY